MGRFLPFVKIKDFLALASCYAELNGRVRPKADVNPLQPPFLS